MSRVARNATRRDTSSENTAGFEASVTAHTWPSIITSPNHTADIQGSGAAISASRNSHQTRRCEFATSWPSAGFLREVASQTMDRSNARRRDYSRPRRRLVIDFGGGENDPRNARPRGPILLGIILLCTPCLVMPFTMFLLHLSPFSLPCMSRYALYALLAFFALFSTRIRS
jgi:hypothetical protein